jgi:hypothetical protein
MAIKLKHSKSSSVESLVAIQRARLSRRPFSDQLVASTKFAVGDKKSQSK